MDKSEILKNCRNWKMKDDGRDFFQSDEEYQLWEDKCIKYYVDIPNSKNRIKDGKEYRILINNNDAIGAVISNVYNYEEALLAFEVFCPQFDRVKVVEVVEKVLLEKQTNK